MKIISVVGARPQFIKLAPFCNEIKNHHGINNIIINSGQHYDYLMSKQFFDELNIPTPKYNLEIGSGSHLHQMGNILLKLDEIYDIEKPDMVVVFGDTNTTSATAIAAAKKNISLAHIESGLREFNKLVPEEVNKLLTDSVADLFFAPTETGITNLKNAGVTKNLYNVGDIGFDIIKNNDGNISKIEIEILQKYDLQKNNFVFMTCHRAANTDIKENLKNILESINKIGEKIIFPIHPRTLQAIKNFKLDHFIENEFINVISPIGFFETQALIKNAKFCLTDSGGVIKEAYFHKVQGIIIDTQTEWVETVTEGWNQLVGPRVDDILKAVEKTKSKPKHYSNALGDGTASKKIIEIIKKYLTDEKKIEY